MKRAMFRLGGVGLYMWAAIGFAASAALSGDTFLVKHGQPLAEIVIAERPTRMQNLAASELQTYIEKISGAELPVVSQPSGGNATRIFVGGSSHTGQLGIKTDDLKHGAYRVASGADWMALVGSGQEFEPVEPWARTRTSGSGGRAERDRLHREWDKITGETFGNPFHYLYPFLNEELQIWEFDDAGTLNAVCDFLRELGVRWFYPGELGEVVPQAKNIALPRENKVVRPDFALRNIGWWSKRISMTTDEDLWNLRMGVNHGVDLIGLTQLCHGSKFVHAREEYKKANPEHFAVYGGMRATDHKGTQGAPCLSSEGFFENHLKYARAVFDHYDEPLISIDVCDGYSRGVCECELCKGRGTPERGVYGSMSDYVFDIESGKWPKIGAGFRITWLGDALCLGITCQEPDMQNLRIGATEEDDLRIWSGDVVEVFVETQFHDYYQIAISPNGVITDLDREKRLESRWSSGAEVATHQGEDAWTIEIRLPAAGENAKEIDPLHGIAGRRPSETYPWFVNVCRQRVRGDETQLFAWSPTGKRRFNVPEKFGKVYAR